jgi:hypothetical protein
LQVINKQRYRQPVFYRVGELLESAFRQAGSHSLRRRAGQEYSKNQENQDLRRFEPHDRSSKPNHRLEKGSQPRIKPQANAQPH